MFAEDEEEVERYGKYTVLLPAESGAFGEEGEVRG